MPRITKTQCSSYPLSSCSSTSSNTSHSSRPHRSSSTSNHQGSASTAETQLRPTGFCLWPLPSMSQCIASSRAIGRYCCSTSLWLSNKLTTAFTALTGWLRAHFTLRRLRELSYSILLYSLTIGIGRNFPPPCAGSPTSPDNQPPT